MAEAQVQGGQEQEVALDGSEFTILLQKEFKPKSEEAKGAVEQAVRTLAEQALAQTTLIGNDVVKSIEAIIAELDKKLSDQVNLIMHHADFQQLESAWRGLHYLVNNTETIADVRAVELDAELATDVDASAEARNAHWMNWTRALSVSTTVMMPASRLTTDSRSGALPSWKYARRCCRPRSGVVRYFGVPDDMPVADFSAYVGSRACSASTNAAVPPSFWISAMTCSVSVVLPEDSGP